MKGKMKILKALVLCSAVFLLAPQSRAQGLLDLAEPADGPDLFSSPLTVSYGYNSMQFVVTGQESAYTDIAGGYDYQTPVIGSFNLTATIDHSGLLTGGTVTAMGDWTGEGNETPLLTGDLVTGAKGTAFDYNSDKMVFMFIVTGGDLASHYGNLAGIALNPWWDGTTNPFNEWHADFNNTDGGSADTVPVPEPSSTLFFLIGGALWWASRRLCRRAFPSAV